MRAGRASRSKVARRTKIPEPVGAAIDNLARHLGITRTLKQYGVVTSWPSIVGEQIAKVTTAQRFEGGILFVGVATAPWRTELTMRRLEIIEKINVAIGQKVVKEIRFR